MKRVAVISTIMALYRYEIANLLSRQDSPSYKFYTSKTSVAGIKPVDYNKARMPAANGGINWSFIRNFYVKNICFWQKGVFSIGISKNYSTLILLGNMYVISTWFNALFGRLTGKHIIMWTHGLNGSDSRTQLFIRVVFYKLAHDLFVYENRSKKLLLKEGFKEDNVHVIYNSLAYEEHLKLRADLSLDKLAVQKRTLFNNDYPTIVYSGRLIKSKQVDMLLKVVSQIKNQNINCLIIGDGEEMDFLTEFVKNKKLKNIYFYGSCYDEKILSQLIGMADIMVSPGNIGLAVVHAFSFGTPVISHDNLTKQGPEVEIIESGVNGILYKHNDIEDLKEKIIYWLETHKDKREKVREKCYLKVDKYYNPYFQVKVFNRVVNRGIK